MFSRSDWQNRPRRVLCILLIMIADLPEGRGNTYIRLGSHMQLADWLKENGQEPVRERPVDFADLPDLPWREPTPVVASAGDVIAFTTNLVHSGTPNLDTEARRVLFLNFCAADQMDYCSPNHDLRERRTHWRDLLRAGFRPERRHLLDGCESAG
jgi:ectoine hydroxylase-related dioxygenase (phytanoyl-CoA dioxygenase family)